MSVHVDSSGRLHHDQERSLAINCPHCQVYSHITAVSVPSYPVFTADPYWSSSTDSASRLKSVCV